jgi:adenylate cyclase
VGDVADQSTALRGESRFLAILFSDISGFTAWSANLAADRVVEALNDYFANMAEVVHAHGGFIDKYIGDGLMVLFWDDVAPEALAERACACALGMLDALRALNEVRAVTGQQPLEARIGLHAGDAILGNIGSYRKVSRSAIGREVNLASRLEGRSEPGRVLCSAPIQQLARSRYRFASRGVVEAKGLGPVDTWWLEGALSG